MTDRPDTDPAPACWVRCTACAPERAWWQPFPSKDAAQRWMAAHVDRYEHAPAFVVTSDNPEPDRPAPLTGQMRPTE